MTELRYLDVLRFADGENHSMGAQQDWFLDIWQQRAGCGPTACANMLWYMAHTDPEAGALCPHMSATRENATAFLHIIWNYVTPGNMGVNSTEILASGAQLYGLEKGVPLEADVLEVPRAARCRPDEGTVADFVLGALEADRPVAFLNLSNGALQNLDSWHWVTLVSFDRDSMAAGMLDEGKLSALDLRVWLSTTVLGGGFVALRRQL